MWLAEIDIDRNLDFSITDHILQWKSCKLNYKDIDYIILKLYSGSAKKPDEKKKQRRQANLGQGSPYSPPTWLIRSNYMYVMINEFYIKVYILTMYYCAFE